MKALIFLTMVLLLSINVLQPKKYLIEVADEEMYSSQEVEHPADDVTVVTEESKKTDMQFNARTMT